MLVIAAPTGPGERTARPAEGVILYGYGGSVSHDPRLLRDDPRLGRGGRRYAVAKLRGGGEEGEEWHRAGMLANKQNVFDDFHAAAEHLIADRRSPAPAPIWGGSNGGLLVGAALTQRPDLFAAVVCSAPLLDMVRYQQFGSARPGPSSTAPRRRRTSRVAAWLLAVPPREDGVGVPRGAVHRLRADTRVDPLHA